MAKNEVATVSNHLISAGYQLSEWEHRIISAAAAQIERGSELTDDDWFILSAEHAQDLFGPQPKNIYLRLRQAVDRLYERSINYRYTPEGAAVTEERHRKSRWVTEVEYRSGEGCIALRWSKRVIPYLSQLSREFTQYSVVELSRLSGKWAPRLYQLLMQWRSIGFVKISLDELRFMLDIPADQYSRTNQLTQYVIHPAVKMIQDRIPELELQMRPVKRGRLITHFAFTFNSNLDTGDAHLQQKLSFDKDVSEDKAGSSGDKKAQEKPRKRHERENVRKALRNIGNTDW